MSKLLAWWKLHRKAVVAVAGLAPTVIQADTGPGNKWVTAIIAVLTAAGVYIAPNTKP